MTAPAILAISIVVFVEFFGFTLPDDFRVLSEFDTRFFKTIVLIICRISG